MTRHLHSDNSVCYQLLVVYILQHSPVVLNAGDFPLLERYRQTRGEYMRVIEGAIIYKWGENAKRSFD